MGLIEVLILLVVLMWITGSVVFPVGSAIHLLIIVIIILVVVRAFGRGGSIE